MQTRRRTVCGMLLGAGLTRIWPHDRAHYFFARARWSPNQLGLALAHLIAEQLIPAGAALEMAVDDTLFHPPGQERVRGGLAARRLRYRNQEDGLRQQLGRGGPAGAAAVPGPPHLPARAGPAVAAQSFGEQGRPGPRTGRPTPGGLPRTGVLPGGGCGLLRQGSERPAHTLHLDLPDAAHRRALRPRAAAHRQTGPPGTQGRTPGHPGPTRCHR
ncbi:transposase [Actinacidiphila oryziradicis]|uniref:Transposase n=1 Tax=Actinacidiphila oryziradicis TaxID=2571141 RepID=A0A4U0RVJ0_9ACTN|nr:transposase [Actinacidiphila oryziradicis]